MKSNGRLLGEFVLIVLGVLVALAVETAFEDRRDVELRNEYLSRLIVDFEADRLALERRIEFFTTVTDFSNDTRAWLETDKAVDQQVLLAAFYAAEIFPFTPNADTYQDLRNTGNIRLLDDIDLRTRLSAYYNKINQSQSAWAPSETYREIIRGVIPNDVQALIRKNCPTTDEHDQIPTGFPPCELPGVNYRELTELFEPLKTDVEFKRTLTYRASTVEIMVYLLTQQFTFADDVLAYLKH